MTQNLFTPIQIRTQARTAPGAKGQALHLETGVFAHAQPSNPQVVEQHLAGGVGDELAVVGGHCQPQVGLLAEGADLVGQQLVGVVIVQLVAVLQQF